MFTDITSIEIAFKKVGLDPNMSINDPELPEKYKRILQNVFELIIASEAIRGNFEPDYENKDQYKWESWYDLNTDENNPSGFRFVCSGYTRTTTGSVLGPLLCQETEEQTIFFSKQFEPILRKLMKDDPTQGKNYVVQMKNDDRGIFIELKGNEALEAWPVLVESISKGSDFIWGGMTIETRASDWKYRESNKAVQEAPELWINMVQSK